MSNLQRLCQKIKYQFNNQALLKQALTHRSMGNHNNERFEFLGDSLLSTVIAYDLFKRFPDKSEGELSRLRAFLVKGDMLANMAVELDLGNYLLLGQGELKSGGYRRSSTLADALEAIFAAVFLDSDFATCQQVILQLYQSRLNDPTVLNNLKDAKTQLQEYLQQNKKSLPEYHLIDIVGDKHDQVFKIVCTLPDLNLSADGQGETRRKAEQRAAQKLLNAIADHITIP